MRERAMICEPRRAPDAPPTIESVRRAPSRVVVDERTSSAFITRSRLSSAVRVGLPVLTGAPRTMTLKREFGLAFASARRAGSMLSGPLLESAR